MPAFLHHTSKPSQSPNTKHAEMILRVVERNTGVGEPLCQRRYFLFHVQNTSVCSRNHEDTASWEGPFSSLLELWANKGSIKTKTQKWYQQSWHADIFIPLFKTSAPPDSWIQPLDVRNVSICEPLPPLPRRTTSNSYQ